MSSGTVTQPHPGQRKRTSVSGYPGNASIFLEKAKAGKRVSTPDSEALASSASDDEQDYQRKLQSPSNLHSSRPARRTSWLTEVQHAPQRKGSLGGGGTFSPTASISSTPPEQAPWAAAVSTAAGSATGRGHSSNNSIPWGNAIWSSDAPKGPPSRLTEVLPSPTTLVPPASAGSFMEESMLSPTYTRENNAESAIPFAIPLQPTLKTYRSQSYSVGQLDPESAGALLTSQSGLTFNNRSRNSVAYAGLHHRPSRPSMLGDLSHDASLLGQLREVEDDNESSAGSDTGAQLASTHAQTIEKLAWENAILRQAAAEQLDNTRTRHQPNTTNLHTSMPRHTTSNHRVYDYIPDAFDGYSESGSTRIGHSYSNEALRARRSSEYAAKSGTQYAMTGIPEHRNLESFKKGHWQSSLGFGGIVETPQSRRHSLAEVPTRQTSISSSGELRNSQKADQGLNPSAGQSVPLGITEGLTRTGLGEGTSYFSGIDPALRFDDSHEASISPVPTYQPYSSNHSYGRPQHLGPQQLRDNQLLYLVTFKACRADVFYVSEGTGLQVKVGDLVIVEADRGTDLGTVLHGSCTWAQARELKERQTEDHFKWLMMFSRHGQSGPATGRGIDGQQVPSSSPHNSAVGTTGAPSVLSNFQEPSSGELKPKMIKRLAQAHEIQTLKEKEGNEAKAKRACQQKVVEHRLNMEILDAEFQMDWKKLTFYYFADTYVNFNPLVTDLFKIYKTRIWMSAINPASFASTATAFQPPSGLGPGAFPSESGPGFEKRQYRLAPNAASISGSQGGYRAPARVWESNPDGTSITQIPLSHSFAQHYPPSEVDVRQLDQWPLEYVHGGQQLQSRYHSGVYGHPNMQHQLYTTGQGTRDNSVRASDNLNTDWSHSFQGLSLGS